MVQHLPKALLLALLVGAPVVAKPPLWEGFRDSYLQGGNRSTLMKNCSVGRELNQQGLNYWGDIYQRKVKERIMISTGISDQIYHEMNNGLAAAMAIACPEVR